MFIFLFSFFPFLQFSRQTYSTVIKYTRNLMLTLPKKKRRKKSLPIMFAALVITPYQVCTSASLELETGYQSDWGTQLTGYPVGLGIQLTDNYRSSMPILQRYHRSSSSILQGYPQIPKTCPIGAFISPQRLF